jgi:hypothetical protein
VRSMLQQLHNYAYIEDSLAQQPAPLCLDDPRLLQTFAEVITRGSPGITIKVIQAKPRMTSYLKSHGCSHLKLLHIFNSDRHHAWLHLPRSPWTGQSPAQARLIASGEAMFHFGRGPQSYAKIRRQHLHESEMQTLPSLADHVRLTIPARRVINLVPIEQYTGEYRYAMLQSSVAQRLQMWAVAWQLFKSAPATGVGTAAYMERAQELVDRGEAPPITASYDHPHNEVLDALSTRGLVGLAALLLLFGVPGWLFAKGLNSPDPVRTGASLAGLMVVVGMAMCGASETMLVHSITLGWYVIMTTMLLVTADATEETGT